MITNNIDDKVRVTIGSTPLIFTNIVSVDVTKGGDMSPYRTGPDVGSMTINLGYKAGETLPSTSSITTGMAAVLQAYISGSWVSHVTMTVADVVYRKQFNDFKNAYDTVITIYAVDSVAAIEAVPVAGVVTSATTKNQTWERRINTTLGPYFTSPKVLPSVGTEAHQYRLVDNNVSGSLADQLNLSCNSVGAMWYVDMDNTARFDARGIYPKTGMLFTDEAGYWNAGNTPANAPSGGTTYLNLEYNDIETSFDSTNIVNSVEVTNVIPANMNVYFATGAILYKDPATTAPQDLEVYTPSYTVEDATSISDFGTRPDQLVTNCWTYKKTETDNYYTILNGVPDPGCEYKNASNFSPAIRLNYSFTSTTPYEGTYAALFNANVADTSYAIYLGPSEGYPLKFTLASLAAFGAYYRCRMRTTNSNTRILAGTEWLDSNGQVISIVNPPTPAAYVLTANTWTTIFVFSDKANAPANAVAWRPRIVIGSVNGSNFAVNTQWRVDNISVAPNLGPADEFSGDTADSASTVYFWAGSPGASDSVRCRNINRTIGLDVLSYWATKDYNAKYLRWNAAQNLAALTKLKPTARVDVRNDGTNYTAWISQINYKITLDAWYVELGLTTRPASWI